MEAEANTCFIRVNDTWISAGVHQVSPCTTPRRTYAEVIAASAPACEGKPAAEGVVPACESKPAEEVVTPPAKPAARKYVMGMKSKRGSTYFFTRPQKTVKKRVQHKFKVVKVPVPAIEKTTVAAPEMRPETLAKVESPIPDFKNPPLPSKADSILPERNLCSLVLESKVNKDHDRDTVATLAKKIKPIEHPVPEILDTSSSHTKVGEWIDKYMIDVATKEEIEDIYAFIDDPKPSTLRRKRGPVCTQSAAEAVNSSPNSTEKSPKGGSDLAACLDTTNERQKGGSDLSACLDTTKERQKGGSDLAACPNCYKLVHRLKQHLQRKCMSNKYGYSDADRMAIISETQDRRQLQRRAIVDKSDLIDNYQTLKGEDYLKYLIATFENCGVLVNKSSKLTLAPPSQREVFTQTSPASPSVASPINSDYNWEEGEVSVDQSGDDVMSATPIHQQQLTSTPKSKVCAKVSQSLEISPIQHSPPKLSPRPTINLNKTPVVVLERLPAKRKLNVSLASHAKANVVQVVSSDSSESTIRITPLKKAKITIPETLHKASSKSSGSTIIIQTKNYTRPVNVKMASLGLYQKFDSDASPVLNQFAKHLEGTLLVTQKDYRNQIVANVNRVLFKLHPAYENPDALADTEAVKEYFKCMPQDLSCSSKSNYIKSLGMFLSFCSQTTSVSERYPKLIEALPAIRESLASIRTGLSKGISRQMAERRGCQFRGERQGYSIKEVMHCVDVMKNKYIDYLDDPLRLSQENLKSINTYFNAVITLKNAHRPLVYSNMLLTEFKKPVKITTSNGDVRYNVGVVEHKTASTQLATVALTESEYREIEKYITNVRPKFANKLSPKTVFLNKNGLKIHNPSMDLRSRQSDLGLPFITSTDARHSFETLSAKLFGKRERTHVANYLAHSLPTASANYVDMTVDQIQGMANSMALLQNPKSWGAKARINVDDDSSSSSAAAAAADASDTDAPNAGDKLRETRYILIKDKFPMTCDSEVPGKWDIQRVARATKGCSAFNDVDFKRIRGRIEYDRMTKRAAEVVAAFPRLRPSNDEIVRYIQEKGWYSKDTLQTVTKTWVPFSGTQPSEAAKDRLEKYLREKIETQKWRGCVISNGVTVANRLLMKGEFICDYHANLLSGEEGTKLFDDCLDSTYRQNMYFFHSRQKYYCIDGNSPCSCHQMPTDQMRGRCIKHVVQGANVIPGIVWVDARPHIIFEAVHTINQGDAIKFDAGAMIETIGEGGAN